MLVNFPKVRGSVKVISVFEVTQQGTMPGKLGYLVLDQS